MGLQIAGKPFDEPTVFRAAYTFQQHARGFERRPTTAGVSRTLGPWDVTLRVSPSYSFAGLLEELQSIAVGI